MQAPKIIISGGGTGGHVFPAIAIANAIKEIAPQAEILFVGAEGRMEMEKVPEAGYEIIGLPIMGLQRRLTLQNLKFPFKLLKSMRKAKKIIKDFKPNVAVGVGGYASGPILKAANNKNIPTLIQEQNSYPGITNKMLAKNAAKICVAYGGMEQFFPKEKIILTGNPVRQNIKNLDSKRERGLEQFGLKAGKKTVLVIGGSLGARTINKSIEKSLPMLKEADIQLVWQTGKTYISQAQQAIEKINSKALQAHQFIMQMDYAYALADIVVSRAGAISVSELCLAAKPTIFIPSPNVAEDHQTKNAMALVNQNAALLLKDSEAEEKLGKAMIDLINNESQCIKLADKIAAIAQPDAAEIIAKEVLKLIS